MQNGDESFANFVDSDASSQYRVECGTSWASGNTSDGLEMMDASKSVVFLKA
jgi:hypothetical protein